MEKLSEIAIVDFLLGFAKETQKQGQSCGGNETQRREENSLAMTSLNVADVILFWTNNLMLHFVWTCFVVFFPKD